MRFDEKLVSLRKNSGLSQEQLAEKLGVSRQAVSRWESGDSTPDMLNLLGLCKCFGVSSDYLINDDYESDEDIPSVKKKNEEIVTIQAKRKNMHLFSAIGFLFAALFTALGLIYTQIRFLIPVFVLAGQLFFALAVIQLVFYFQKR